MAPEPYYIDVDLKRDTNYKFFTVTQNDTDVTLIVRVADNGLITETLLDHFTTITLSSERPIDRKSFYVTGERILGTNEIRFKLGTSELANVGTVSASVQLYSEDGRMTTAHFSYKVRKDHTDQYVPSENEASLIERILVDGPRIMTEAETATADAIQAITDLTGAVNGSLETLQTDKAAALQEIAEAVERGNTAAQNADDERVRLTEEVTRSVADVDEVVRYTSEEFLPGIAQSVSDMDLIVQDSNAKSTDALDKATVAKTTAETVRTEFDEVVAEAGSSNPEVVNARGTYATLKQRLDNSDSKLADSDRQTQLLQHGVNILNADVATPVDFEIQGRTLTSLANSNLEALKYYALADKKLKVIVDGVTVAGIGKFQKKSTTLTTADFNGKVSGSTTANPHMMRYKNQQTTLHTPTTSALLETGQIVAVYTLNGTSAFINEPITGTIAQHIFSFNIIEQVERQLGLIPKTTVAEKVQWIKDNVNSFKGNWYGFGSGPLGNKATFSMYSNSLGRFQTADEGTGGTTHALGAVNRLTAVSTNPADRIQSDGFIHFLAYAEASDGVTASTINTDFINLEIELKTAAQLNTRGKIIRVENFEGKVAGSVVENPHKAFRSTSASILSIVPATGQEHITDSAYNGYGRLNSLDGNVAALSGMGAGLHAFHSFSFNLIEAVERNIGKIPAADVAEKVAWLKNNVSTIWGIWNGSGSGPLGNKASFSLYYSGRWNETLTHTSGAVTKLSRGNNLGLDTIIQDDGFVHYLAHAEPSDGTIASTINTDYVELTLELKPTANFSNPKIPLYEVTKEDFDKIGVSWTDQDTLKRFPVVEGTQHLLNPYVIAEGENLLPPFMEWTLHANARVVSPYELELNATSPFYQISSFEIPVSTNQPYSFAYERIGDTRVSVREVDEKGTVINNLGGASYTNNIAISGTTNANTKKLRFELSSISGGVFTFKNTILSLGTQPKPFTPRNPSYLYAETKLGAIGTVKDVLYRQDGQWKRRKVLEKDFVLDGTLSWGLFNGITIPEGHALLCPYPSNSKNTSVNYSASKFNGNVLKLTDASSLAVKDSIYFGSSNFVLGASAVDTGWTNAPSGSDIKRYFNGWKYSDGTTWTSVTSNGQTVTAQQALDTKPTDYTPYKLSYVLATPVTENVTIEGDIVADGQTQMEVGSGFTYSEVDGKRTYTRTPADQRYKLTSNAVDPKAIYAKTIRSAHDDMAVKVGDLATITSVNVRAIAELYKRMNALGG